MTIDALFVQSLLAIVIPLIVGVVTKMAAPAWLKSLAMIVLNGAAGIVTISTQADGTAVLSKATVVTGMLGIAQSVAMYYGLWKPAGVSGAVQLKTAEFGITTPTRAAA